ncbi:acid phosphatase Pho12p [[Candida] jaroonii]|uniref:Acid phosphatase Pho12p n=1 Tax=[Candida] jaroonii TaxID=467808 RepID=A0ACA9Y1F2_9ASCO|nr:acid phosphatase Pho12p [[Candida] jaroonii]
MKATSFLNGLLFGIVGEQFDTVATPQLASIEQFNVVGQLGGAAPYKQFPGYGIWPDLPEEAELLQVQYIGRHGERFPTKGSGASYKTAIDKLDGLQLNGSLAALQDYKYFVTDASQYGLETTANNTNGNIYSGELSAKRNGAVFREKYASLYNPELELPVFTSGSQRVHDTALNFIAGFGAENVKLNIISEDASMGGNSLTPKKGCDDYNTYGDGGKFEFDQFYDEVTERLMNDNPNANLTADDVEALFAACAYEINVEGKATICSIFSIDELIKSEYSDDLDLYYNYGAGNNYTRAIGSVYTKAQLELLKEESDNKIWLSFTHDDDIVTYYSSLGFFDDPVLPKDKLLFRKTFSKSVIIPQSTRLILEKYAMNNETYVRWILNDAVLPLEQCANGPGFGCQIDQYIDIMEQRVENYDFNEFCGTDGADEISFFWDYNTTVYNATLKV